MTFATDPAAVMTTPLGVHSLNALNGTRIYVVDDSDGDRLHARRILAAHYAHIQEFTGGKEFLERLDGLDRGCVVLDVMMPLIDGLTVVRALNAERPDWPVVMMSGQADVAIAVEAMKRGAKDFVEKPCDAAALAEAVDRALKLSRHETVAARPAHRMSQLITPRELDVLKLLMAGKQNKAIAFSLGISERTVEVHRARLMRRLGVRSFAELIRKAVEHGLPGDETRPAA